MRREKMKKLTLLLVLISLSAATLITFGRDRSVVQPADKLQPNSSPTFWTELTGRDQNGNKDGFDLYVSSEDDAQTNCRVTVKITMSDDSTKPFDYSGTVRKNSKAWFGGEAGLKPAPIKSAEIISKSCS